MATLLRWRFVGDSLYYQVSTRGSVRSLDKLVKGRNGKKLKKGKVLKAGIGGNEYKQVSVDGITKSIHIIVADAFIPNPLNLPQINHKDGDKLNNDLSNLERCTCAFNTKHTIDNNLTNHSSKMRTIERRDWEGVIKEYPSMRKAASSVKGCHQAISKCCAGSKPTYKGYTWNFKK